MDDNVEIARAALAAGSTPDEVATHLLAEIGLPPIPAIKALRAACGLDLNAAKEIVHRNLPADSQAAAERLWDALEADLLANPDDGSSARGS